MGRQTETAAAAAHARGAWREHLDECVPCSSGRHRRGRRRIPLCAEGLDLRAAVVDAEDALAAERAAGRKPPPGQAELPLDLPGQLELFGDYSAIAPDEASAGTDAPNYTHLP